MNEIQRQVLNKLKNDHKGKCRAITYKRLAFVLELNERDVRQAVSELVSVYSYPIASSQNGYWYITNQEEFEIAYKELLSRIKVLSARAKGLRIGWQKEIQHIKPTQLELVQMERNWRYR